MVMSYQKREIALAGVRPNAREVYGCIPAEDEWSYSRIHQEMQRTGHNVRKEAIMACVVALKDAGLVVESSRDLFRRAPHKPKPQLQAVPQPAAIDAQHEEEPPMEPIKTVTRPTGAPPPAPRIATATDRLGALAARVRKASEDMAAIANELDQVAVDIEENGEQAHEAISQLGVLRQALKGIL